MDSSLQKLKTKVIKINNSNPVPKSAHYIIHINSLPKQETIRDDIKLKTSEPRIIKHWTDKIKSPTTNVNLSTYFKYKKIRFHCKIKNQSISPHQKILVYKYSTYSDNSKHHSMNQSKCSFLKCNDNIYKSLSKNSKDFVYIQGYLKTNRIENCFDKDDSNNNNTSILLKTSQRFNKVKIQPLPSLSTIRENHSLKQLNNDLQNERTARDLSPINKRNFSSLQTSMMATTNPFFQSNDKINSPLCLSPNTNSCSYILDQNGDIRLMRKTLLNKRNNNCLLSQIENILSQRKIEPNFYMTQLKKNVNKNNRKDIRNHSEKLSHQRGNTNNQSEVNHSLSTVIGNSRNGHQTTKSVDWDSDKVDYIINPPMRSISNLNK